jgi:hypothetical protein
MTQELKELDRVKLTKAYGLVPKDTEGTIVYKYHGAEFVEVETIGLGVYTVPIEILERLEQS